MIVDVRNNSFNKNTFYRELKGVLRKLVNERNIRLVVCEDPIPAKGKKYASTVLLELRGQVSAWMEEIPEFNQASFNSLYPQSWKALIVDKAKGKHRSNDKECIASDICDIVPRFRKYKNIYASKDYDASAIDGIQQFNRLAPSADLFAFTQANKDTEGFWSLYHEMFQKELVSNEKQVGLALVEDLVRMGVEVNLVCFCYFCMF